MRKKTKEKGRGEGLLRKMRVFVLILLNMELFSLFIQSNSSSQIRVPTFVPSISPQPASPSPHQFSTVIVTLALLLPPSFSAPIRYNPEEYIDGKNNLSSRKEKIKQGKSIENENPSCVQSDLPLC